jgi:hypothetical protein
MLQKLGFLQLFAERISHGCCCCPQSYALAEVAVITRRSGSCIRTPASDHRQGTTTGVQCPARQHTARVGGELLRKLSPEC